MLGTGDTFEGYRIEQLLQSVGMVHTYLVVHEKENKYSILKVLREHFISVPRIQKTFVAQYKRAQLIQHENLLSIEHIFPKESAVVLEHLHGMTLAKKLKKTPKIDPFIALRWAAQVLCALNVLHQQRVVHLEVSPANIFLVPAEKGIINAVLMDHGIGHRIHEGANPPDFSEHSKLYLSPELISNRSSAKFRSDIYSLGVVLFEMMSGEKMIAGEDESQILKAIVRGERKGFKEAAPHVPTSIAMVIEQSLQINPVSRYPTATAFMDALVRAVGGPLIEEDTQESPEHDDFNFLMDELEEEDVDVEEMKEASSTSPSTSEKKTKNKNTLSKAQNKQKTDTTHHKEPKEGSQNKARHEKEEETTANHQHTQEDQKRPQGKRNNERVVLDATEHVDAELLNDSASYDIDGKIITLAHSAQEWTEAKLIPSDGSGWRIVLNARVLIVLAALFFLSLVVGGVEAQSRSVVITITDKPQWGELAYVWNGTPKYVLDFEDLPPGEHILVVSGGIFEGESCTRCCWERRFDFSFSMGFSQEYHEIVLEKGDEGLPRCPTLEAGYDFASIPAGSFDMGSPIEDENRHEDEIVHRVVLSQNFSMGKTEVTQLLYQAVTQQNPARYKGKFQPVETVSWFEVVDFCNQLSIMEGLEPCYEIDANYVGWKAGLSCTGYRLPTEAEWEYAARADGNTTYGQGNNPNDMWYGKNSRGQTQEVMKKPSNALGLYDMSGNVSEWVWDYFGPYSTENYRDPKGPNEGVYRVMRGGDWMHIAKVARVQTRQESAPLRRSPYIGFRIVQSVHDAKE